MYLHSIVVLLLLLLILLITISWILVQQWTVLKEWPSHISRCSLALERLTLKSTSSLKPLFLLLLLRSFYSVQYPGCYSPFEEEDNLDGRPPCPHRFGSILSSSYFTLLNLFGEFPLVDEHSTAGRYLGVFTAVVRRRFSGSGGGNLSWNGVASYIFSINQIKMSR